MSFRLYIYYCALCGGWAAFVAWLIVQTAGVLDLSSTTLRATVIGAFLGSLVAMAVGAVDAVLNATGFQRVLRALVCLGLGLVGGAVGALIGQLLKDGLGFPLFIGWIVAGVMIGGSIGVFDLLRAMTGGQDVRASLNKTLNGVYGGFLGGFVGGLPFTFLVGNPLLPRSSLAISLVILGICIGLLVGLAQVILKEAWVKVEQGFRAGRQLLLTRDETTIGRAEGCDLGLFGDSAVEKLHACIVLKNNRYLLDHVAEYGETLLNDEPVTRPTPLRNGDEIRLGRSLLVFGEKQKRKK